jgi:hypothetical protein
MRVYGPNGTALATAPLTGRRTEGGTFTVNEQGATPNSPAATTLRSISTLDALIALQGIENPGERKKRAVAKGRNALDVLDTLKLGLLDGSVDQSTLARLKVASEGLTDASGDTGLDGVLGEIDLRVAVELAKAGIR